MTRTRTHTHTHTHTHTPSFLPSAFASQKRISHNTHTLFQIVSCRTMSSLIRSSFENIPLPLLTTVASSLESGSSHAHKYVLPHLVCFTVSSISLSVRSGLVCFTVCQIWSGLFHCLSDLVWSISLSVRSGLVYFTVCQIWSGLFHCLPDPPPSHFCRRY